MRLKRVILSVLILSFCLVLSACGGSEKKEKKSGSKKEVINVDEVQDADAIEEFNNFAKNDYESSTIQCRICSRVESDDDTEVMYTTSEGYLLSCPNATDKQKEANKELESFNIDTVYEFKVSLLDDATYYLLELTDVTNEPLVKDLELNEEAEDNFIFINSFNADFYGVGKKSQTVYFFKRINKVYMMLSEPNTESIVFDRGENYRIRFKGRGSYEMGYTFLENVD